MTTWTPDHRINPRVWILEDGTQMEPPELEVSGSHLKWRLKGRQDTSVFEKDRERIIQQGVRERTPDDNPVLLCMNRSRTDSLPELPEVGLTFDDKGTINPFTCVWVFHHETLPLRAEIQVHVKRTYRSYEVITRMSFDEISDRAKMHPRVSELGSGRWSTAPLEEKQSEEIKRSNIQGKHFDRQQYRSERAALAHLRDQIERFQDWDEVAIPDTRDGAVRWITLTFDSTNVEGELLATLADYLDSEALAEEVLEKYNELRGLLRQLGVVIEERQPDDFQRAATTEGEKALVVKVQASRPDGEDDNLHGVYLHLLTGTISVSCPLNKPSEKEAAESWQLARFEAEMKGELDSFLAHYEGLVENRDRNQVLDVITERRG